MKFLSLFLFVFSSLQANPKNPSLVSGIATFSSSSNLLEVTLSNRAILNWESFSIDKGETVHLYLPNCDCTTLQRITGKAASIIDGLLTCSGKLYLINPNGIVIGPKGVIDTASFIGSTLDIEDHAFCKGEKLLCSTQKRGSITHYGTIKARSGSITLIGVKVQNQGRLEVPNGTSQIAVGERFLLRPENQSHIFIEALRDPSHEQEMKWIKTVSSSPYAYAMHLPALEQAKGCRVDPNGRVFLVSHSPAKAPQQMGKANAEVFYQVARAITDHLFLFSMLYDRAAFCNQISPADQCLPFLRPKIASSEAETSVFGRY